MGPKDCNRSFVAFTTDGKTLLAWDAHGVMKEWTVATGKQDVAECIPLNEASRFVYEIYRRRSGSLRCRDLRET